MTRGLPARHGARVLLFVLLAPVSACAPGPSPTDFESDRAPATHPVVVVPTTSEVAPPSEAPTKRLPAAIATVVSRCPGMRTGAQRAAGTIVSARYETGSWWVEVEGLWEFHGVLNATPPGSTPDPRYRGQELVNRCELRIDADGHVRQGSYSVVTATPPAVGAEPDRHRGADHPTP